MEMIDKKAKLEKVVNVKECKENLRHLWLDVDKRVLYATNGHIAVITPVVVFPEDVTGTIPVDVFLQARKAAGNKHNMQIQCFADKLRIPLTGSEFLRPKLDGYPVLEDYSSKRENPVMVRINASSLYDLALAIGSDAVVDVALDTSLDPIMVTGPETCGNATAIIMPVRGRKDDNEGMTITYGKEPVFKTDDFERIAKLENMIICKNNEILCREKMVREQAGTIATLRGILAEVQSRTESGKAYLGDETEAKVVQESHAPITVQQRQGLNALKKMGLA